MSTYRITDQNVRFSKSLSYLPHGQLRAELDASTAAISSQARSHVHADELLLTYGASALVERFLRAAGTRRFRLLLAEGPDVAEVSGGVSAPLSAARGREPTERGLSGLPGGGGLGL